MELQLYNFTGDEREINKSIGKYKTLTGTLRDKATLDSPIILVQTDPSNYNYLYIPAFSRYYYIRNTTQYRKNIWIISLEEDVLYTYKDNILNLEGIVSQLNESSYINDSGIFDVRDTHERIDFDSELKLGSNILIVRGGH